MYLVNTTFSVEPAVHGQWLRLIREDYIPMLGRKGYDVAAFSRVLHAENTGHYTYSLLVRVPDIPHYQELTGEIFAEYTALAGELWGSHVLWFTSLMKIIE